jgi:hypothetical protein
VTSGACIGCWTGCIGGGIVCLAAAAGACTWAGPFYAVCFAIAAAACAIGEWVCMELCYAEGHPCCPVGCGEVACCEDGETCLNSTTGLCCSPGLTPCAGENCCESTEVCLGTGPLAGTCCEAENVCGTTCCGSLEVCAPGGFCCGFNQKPCNGGCCKAGEECLGGDTCCPAAQACGNNCCDVDQKCTNPALGICEDICPEGQKVCLGAGNCCDLNEVCAEVVPLCCPAGMYYCFGACRHPSECVH